MANNLRLEVLLKAVDKVTAPMKKMMQSNQKVAQAIKASRDELKSLDAAQKNIKSFRELSQKAKETSRALTENQQKITALTREMRASGAPTQAMINERNKLINQSRKLTETQRTQRTALQNLRTKINETTGTTGTLSERNKQLADRVKQANEQLKNQQNQLARTAERQRKLAQISADYQKNQARANAVIGAGAGASATGAAVGYAGAKMMAPGMDFEAAISNVQALTRLDKTDPQLEALKAQLRELGATTSFSATQAADAAGFLAMAGFDPKQIMASMPSMLDLSIATGTELARTADIASNIMGGFGISADEMDRVGDVLVAASTRANVNLEMLGESMKYVGPVARDMGVGFEEAAAMAALLGDVGIQGSQAGTSMRSIILRLTKQTPNAAKAIEDLGIKTADAEGNLRPVPELIAELAKATEGMGSVQKGDYLQTIFGAEPAAAISELINKQGAAGIDEFVKTLKNAQGENAKVAKVMGDNTKGDIGSLNSAWEDVGITMQTLVAEPLRETIQSVTNLTRNIGLWMNKNPELTATIIKVGGAIAGILVVGGSLLMFLGMVVKPILLAVSVMKILAVAVMAVSWPVLAVIAAIAALAAAVYLIYDNWGPITDWVKNFIAGFQEAWQGGFWSVLEWSKNLFVSIAKVFLDFNPVALLYKNIAQLLSWFGVDLPGSFTEAGGALMDGLVSGITGKIKAVKDTITNVGSSVTGWFKNVMGINSPSRVFSEFGVNTLEGYEEGLDEKQKSTIDSVKGVAKKVAAAGAGMALAGGVAATDVPIDTRPPLSAAPVASQSAGDNITINVHAAPGMDLEQLALMVKQQLDQRDREKARRSRASLTDRD